MIAWQKRNDPSQEQAPPGSTEAAIRIVSKAILPKELMGDEAPSFKTMQALFKQSAAIHIVQPWKLLEEDHAFRGSRLRSGFGSTDDF